MSAQTLAPVAPARARREAIWENAAIKTVPGSARKSEPERGARLRVVFIRQSR
jgi:hypothetical protein